jgi:hypothetical protein
MINILNRCIDLGRGDGVVDLKTVCRSYRRRPGKGEPECGYD